MDTEDLERYVITILKTIKSVGHYRCEVRIETLRRLICDLTNEVDNRVSHAIGNLELDYKIVVNKGWVQSK